MESPFTERGCQSPSPEPLPPASHLLSETAGEAQSVSGVNRPGSTPVQSPPRSRHLNQWWPTAAPCFWHCHACHAFRSTPKMDAEEGLFFWSKHASLSKLSWNKTWSPAGLQEWTLTLTCLLPITDEIIAKRERERERSCRLCTHISHFREKNVQ